MPLDPRVQLGSNFEHVVLNPECLSVLTLSDNIRFKLANYYENLKYSEKLVSFLRLPYAGNELHNTMVSYIAQFDKTRDRKILEIVPELAGELVYL